MMNRVKHRRINWILLSLLGLAGCGGAPDTGLPPLRDLNVLVIVIDTLGSGHVGAVSDGLDTTPHLDALARGGVLFDNAYSVSPWTQPTLASVMTGLTPSNHGTLHLYDALSPEPPTLATEFQAAGHRTAGVVSHFLIGKKLGYDRGFQTYDESAVSDHHRAISSPQVLKAASGQLELLKDERFFLFVHFFDPHSHYLHHPDFDRTSGYTGPVRDWDHKITELRKRLDDLEPADTAYLRDLYREEIAFTDHHVGLLLQKLEDLGLRENTLVILTADHGEEFMEHQWIGHTRFLYDTLVKVPLIVSLPGRLAPAVNSSPVSLLDIMPTLLALDGRKFDGDGRSLLPLLGGGAGDPERPLFMEVAFPPSPVADGGTPGDTGTYKSGLVQGRWKLIHDLVTDRLALFDLQADPGETRDLFRPTHPAVRDLGPRLAAWEAGKVETWGLGEDRANIVDEEEKKRLRSLGYIR